MLLERATHRRKEKWKEKCYSLVELRVIEGTSGGRVCLLRSPGAFLSSVVVIYELKVLRLGRLRNWVAEPVGAECEKSMSMPTAILQRR